MARREFGLEPLLYITNCLQQRPIKGHNFDLGDLIILKPWCNTDQPHHGTTICNLIHCKQKFAQTCLQHLFFVVKHQSNPICTTTNLKPITLTCDLCIFWNRCQKSGSKLFCMKTTLSFLLNSLLNLSQGSHSDWKTLKNEKSCALTLVRQHFLLKKFCFLHKSVHFLSDKLLYDTACVFFCSHKGRSMGFSRRIDKKYKEIGEFSDLAKVQRYDKYWKIPSLFTD